MFLLGLYGPACAIDPGRVNTACEWAHDAAAPLDTARDERHLIADVTVAEELAIRYADATRGFRSGHYVSQGQYVQTREQCLFALFSTIAATHNVDARDVRLLLHRRSLLYDGLVVLLPMTVLFAAAADLVTRRVYRRFAADERGPRVLALLIASIVVTAAGYQAGALWSFFAEEELRLRTNHLSYRAFYLPWSRHPVIVVCAGMLLFWLIVRARRNIPTRPDSNFVE